MINNSYRDFNFAFSNQVALICKDLGLDAKEVVDSANFGYKRSNVLQPGFVAGGKAGFVGGVCLEKDPYILVDSSSIGGGLIKAAREINEGLIDHVFDGVKKHILDNNIPLKDARIFISGLAFKGHPETDDMRGSPALRLIDKFKKAEMGEIYAHDFVIKSDEIEKLGAKPCSIEEGFKLSDVLIFMNNHKKYNDLAVEALVLQMKENALLYDGWQFFSDKIKKMDIHYESIGFKKTKNRLA